MVDFLLGILSGCFLMILLLQLTTKKTINLAEVSDKYDDPKRYWNFILAYLVDSLGAIGLFLFYDKL